MPKKFSWKKSENKWAAEKEEMGGIGAGWISSEQKDPIGPGGESFKIGLALHNITFNLLPKRAVHVHTKSSINETWNI